MTTYNRLYDGISNVAWGYFFLYFDINLGTVSVLPNFVGFLLFLKAIDLLKIQNIRYVQNCKRSPYSLNPAIFAKYFAIFNVGTTYKIFLPSKVVFNNSLVT